MPTFQYPSGDKVTTDYINRACQSYQDKPAFTCLGHTLTFAEIDVLSKRFAAYLQTQTSLNPGDRISIQLPNILQYPVALYGAMRAGLVVVNTNPLYTPREIRHQLHDSGAKALVVLANVADAASSIIHETDVTTVIVTEVGDLLPRIKKQLLNGYLKFIKRVIPKFQFPKSVHFDQVMEQDERDYKSFTANSEDIAVLQYTGGTTGVAKGAMLTHKNLIANKDQVLDRMISLFEEADSGTHVAPLPLYHIYGFTVHMASLFSYGNHSLLIPNPRDLKSMISAMSKETIVNIVGLNTLFLALCHEDKFKSLDFSHLRNTQSGGMALNPDTGRLWKEVTGVTVNEGYGLTEASPVVSNSPAESIQSGTIGTPLVDTEIIVVDENGATLPRGSVGELCVRGPQVMKGYWRNPEATVNILNDEGWLLSGDIAIIQEDGYIRIVDRKKDMILVSGFNVYPNEIEDVITEHPLVREAGAIGVEDEYSGEVVKLFVVPENSSLTKQQILDFCRERLTGYKIPKFIEFIEELPKSAVGKVLRRELRDLDRKNKSVSP